jgi:hypothetical protein
MYTVRDQGIRRYIGQTRQCMWCSQLCLLPSFAALVRLSAGKLCRQQYVFILFIYKPCPMAASWYTALVYCKEGCGGSVFWQPFSFA